MSEPVIKPQNDVPVDLSDIGEGDHEATTTVSENPFTLNNAKKAYAAGLAGAVTGAGTISLTGIFADGKLDTGEVGGVVIAVVGGFILGFVGAWFPTNSTKG